MACLTLETSSDLDSRCRPGLGSTGSCGFAAIYARASSINDITNLFPPEVPLGSCNGQERSTSLLRFTSRRCWVGAHAKCGKSMCAADSHTTADEVKQLAELHFFCGAPELAPFLARGSKTCSYSHLSIAPFAARRSLSAWSFEAADCSFSLTAQGMWTTTASPRTGARSSTGEQPTLTLRRINRGAGAGFGPLPTQHVTPANRLHIQPTSELRTLSQSI